ncbi:hypothetical protein [Methylobacterium nigriterrae]|uniref:hypothetical protein n=1 Tax=Methylobacterium nigriterrae TaxID=3127512 RepID=UPI003013EC7F
MAFTIIAVRHGVSIFNRRVTPREALFLASSRVQDGAEAVQVYDDQSQFVSAATLADAARRQAGALDAVQQAVDQAVAELQALSAGPESRRVTIRVGADPRAPAEPHAEADVTQVAVPTEPDEKPPRRGRVRVFRAGRKGERE